MKKMSNLKKAIAELNAPIMLEADDEFEEMIIDSPFKFKIRESDGQIEIYDSNEMYGIYYDEEMYCLMHDAAKEFGFEEPKEVRDTVHEKLLDAVKKDFGEDAFLDWYDSVVMMVCK